MMTANMWTQWAVIEDDVRMGLKPDPRHVAAALYRGEPVRPSAELQRYLAALIVEPAGIIKVIEQIEAGTLRPLPLRRRRGRPKQSVGARHAAAVALINQVVEARKREIDLAGERGSLKRALDSIVAEGGIDIERQYRSALRLRKSAK